MFIRWQSRKRETYVSFWSRKGDDWYGDVHWNAVLVESVRVKGKPRQKHIANLCGFTAHQVKNLPHHATRAWETALERLNRLGGRVSPDDRRRIEASLAKKIGRNKPTKREIAAMHKEADSRLASIANKIKALR
jgi:hypothetical protein